MKVDYKIRSIVADGTVNMEVLEKYVRDSACSVVESAMKHSGLIADVRKICMVGVGKRERLLQKLKRNKLRFQVDA